jgi:hypothetical protein
MLSVAAVFILSSKKLENFALSLYENVDYREAYHFLSHK